MTKENKLITIEQKSVDFYEDSLTAVPTLKQYQREAAKVLWEAFQNGRLAFDPTFDELLQTDSEVVQAYRMALDVAKSARNRVLREMMYYG